MSNVRFTSFPRTAPSPSLTPAVVAAFQANEASICTRTLQKGLTSDAVLAAVRPDLVELGFTVEASKLAADKIKRPVFFGENGEPGLQYEIDPFHAEWSCGLEIEAGRGWMGNAVYRDLIQALVMVELGTLVLAVANTYRYQSGGKLTISRDYENTVAVADSLYGHSRIAMPYRLIVLATDAVRQCLLLRFTLDSRLPAEADVLLLPSRLCSMLPRPRPLADRAFTLGVSAKSLPACTRLRVTYMADVCLSVAISCGTLVLWSPDELIAYPP